MTIHSYHQYYYLQIYFYRDTNVVRSNYLDLYENSIKCIVDYCGVFREGEVSTIGVTFSYRYNFDSDRCSCQVGTSPSIGRAWWPTAVQ